MKKIKSRTTVFIHVLKLCVLRAVCAEYCVSAASVYRNDIPAVGDESAAVALSVSKTDRASVRRQSILQAVVDAATVKNHAILT